MTPYPSKTTRIRDLTNTGQRFIKLSRAIYACLDVSEGRTTARGTSARTAARRAEAAGSPTILVAVLGLLTLLEGVELVGEGDHAVTAEGVVINILDVVTGDVAEDVLLLSQDVIDRDGQ